MAQRVAEDVVRRRRFGPKLLLRVDLHGVSAFGPGGRRTAIRWEWIESIALVGGVTVRSSQGEVTFPPGAFGLDPDTLAKLLEEARSIDRRTEVIGQLNKR